MQINIFPRFWEETDRFLECMSNCLASKSSNEFFTIKFPTAFNFFRYRVNASPSFATVTFVTVFKMYCHRMNVASDLFLFPGSKSEVSLKREVSFDFATEICGLTKEQHKVEGKIGKAKLLGLCGLEAIVKHGCIDNRNKSLNGDIIMKLDKGEEAPDMNE